MASYNQRSERALATYGLEAVPAQPGSALRVLIGGLGMGVTLHETLSSSGMAVDVVEMNPAIIEWNTTYLTALHGGVLSDDRVTIIRDDVYTILYASPPLRYQAILLDVDNGPSWVSHACNTRLYTLSTLKRIAHILPSGGVLTVWSAQPEPEFFHTMHAVFDRAEEIPILVSNHHGRRLEHFLYRGIAA